MLEELTTQNHYWPPKHWTHRDSKLVASCYDQLNVCCEHHHLSSPSNFFPSVDSSAVAYLVCSHFRGSPGNAYPSGAILFFQELILHWRSGSLSSSAGIIDMYWAILTLSFVRFARIPCGCELLKIKRSPAFNFTFVGVKPVVSGLK